jgi:hypothetical protein
MNPCRKNKRIYNSDSLKNSAFEPNKKNIAMYKLANFRTLQSLCI